MADDNKKDYVSDHPEAEAKQFSIKKIPVKVVGIYLAAGSLWIAFSDQLLAMIVSDPDTYIRLQTFKGWFYVLLTGLLLYVLIRGNLQKLHEYQRKLVRNYEELEAAYEELVAMEEELQASFDRLQEKQKKIEDTEEKFRLVVEGSNECIWDWDVRSRALSFQRTKLLLGYDADELEDTLEAWESLVHPEDLENVHYVTRQHMDGKTPYYYCEYRMKTKWGEYRWIQSRGKAVWNEENTPLRAAGSHVDVTEQKRLMHEMYQMAYYDPLTSLPNRALFYDHLKKIMASHFRRGGKFGLITLDLDDFRRINDTRGHPFGNRVLEEVARRINAVLGQNEFAARSGGNEFYVLKSRLKSGEELTSLAEKLLTIFDHPFQIDAHELFITASAGLALYPDHGTDRDTLLQHADVALSEAKNAGKNKYWLFDSHIRERIAGWMEREKDLRYAVIRQEFCLFYQPVIQLSTGTVKGVEALIRWNHPRQGLVSPGAFIQLAEETDLIHPIGEWVLEQACQSVKAWKRLGFTDIDISINISPVQFRRMDLPEWIHRTISQHDMDPRRLVIEITESAAMDNVGHTYTMLDRIRKLGIRVALDDFGTGYSSLNYLRSLPLDILKIDKTFVDNMGEDPRESFIVRQIIDLAHELDLTVTAEGVEEERQIRVLRQYGCDHVQGYYYHPPMSEDNLISLIHPLERQDKHHREAKNE